MVPDVSPASVERLIEELKRYHHVSDDCWYSCPLSDEGCCNHDETGCTCGATTHNEQVDAALEAVRALLAERDAWKDQAEDDQADARRDRELRQHAQAERDAAVALLRNVNPNSYPVIAAWLAARDAKEQG